MLDTPRCQPAAWLGGRRLALFADLMTKVPARGTTSLGAAAPSG